jgi:hypothetical protein
LGAYQQRAFENIKRYLSSPPVMKAPMAGIPFRLYIATEDVVIGAILMQVTEGKEHVITYLNRCLIDPETRDENIVANDLAQQASGFRSNRGKFGFLEKTNVLVCQTGQFSF